MKRLLIALVKFYRRYISPLKPPCCRFIPVSYTHLTLPTNSLV